VVGVVLALSACSSSGSSSGGTPSDTATVSTVPPDIVKSGSYKAGFDYCSRITPEHVAKLLGMSTKDRRAVARAWADRYLSPEARTGAVRGCLDAWSEGR
jgi:hypothetical protein